MNDMGNNYDSRFGGGTMMNPFQMPGMNSEISNQNSMLDTIRKTDEATFDVEDLVKKIDAKIAELEAEEKNQSDNSEKQEDKFNINDLSPDRVIEAETTPVEKEVPVKEEQPKDKTISDEAFFDDFFSDE